MKNQTMIAETKRLILRRYKKDDLPMTIDETKEREFEALELGYV